MRLSSSLAACVERYGCCVTEKLKADPRKCKAAQESRAGVDPLGDSVEGHGMSRTLIVAAAIVHFAAGPVLAADPAMELVAAATAGRVETVTDLLAQGADANAKNGAGRPALVAAAYSGNRRTAAALLVAGADPNAADSAGNTALMGASAMGHVDTVRLLVAVGAKKDAKNAAGEDAVAMAQRAGHAAVEDMLSQ
jgi:hypothetical protein